MNRIFHEQLGKYVLCYLDDICVYSRTPEEHLVHLEKVFEILRTNKFFAKQSKCDFNKPELPFLCHIVGRNGLKMDPKNVSVRTAWSTPTTQKELRSFLGLENYFRRFVSNYSTLAHPLTALTGCNVPWSWTPVHDTAFQAIKTALVNPPVLALPDFTKPFAVVSDASLQGTGAVLLQEGRPIAFTSKKFIAAERNYTTGEQELLGVITALKEWRCYLEGGSTLSPSQRITTLTHTYLHNPRCPVDKLGGYNLWRDFNTNGNIARDLKMLLTP